MAPTAVIDIDPGVFHHAASVVFGVASAFSSASGELSAALASSGSMAGSDEAGATWGGQYDEAAGQVVDTVGALVPALVNYSRLLTRGGFNYQAAEADSAGRPIPQQPDPPQIDLPRLAPVPSAIGDSGPGLQGAVDLASAVGVPCPNGDVEKLARAAQDWIDFGRLVEAARAELLSAAADIYDRVQVPEVAEIYRELRFLASASEELRALAESIASLCRDFADQLTDTRTAIKEVIERFAVEQAAAIAVSVGLAFLTAGVSAAAGAAISAGRFATTARTVQRIVAGLRIAFAERRIDRNLSAARRTTDDLDEIASRPEVGLDGAAIPAKPGSPPGWGNARSLQDHFDRHGADVGAASADEYARMAAAFRDDGFGRLPTKVTPDGTIRIYDPETNLFAAYNADGTTRTFFSPKSAAAYWDRQPGEIR